jgi:hypothetical protein
MTAPKPIWFSEPEQSEDDCRCIFSGDTQDTRWCPTHREGRVSAVKLVPVVGQPDICPF